MKKDRIFNKALNSEFLSLEEGVFLYKNVDLTELMFIGNELRKKNQSLENRNKVGWIVDRNVNITNVCIAQCKFCNFYRPPSSKDVYITTIDEYEQKIDELRKLGGNQLLLQGGLHPKLDLKYYKNLFSELKTKFPDIKLHALGPAEIHYISKISKTTYSETLKELINSGLDSLPGAGAEILSDRVRNIVSKGKCSSEQWLKVMEEAHKLNITTSATMMFGHVETIEERIEHFIKLCNLQNIKPEKSEGFTTFIPWPFQDKDTQLLNESGTKNNTSPNEYIRMIALSRIMMPNIKNIQASWLTVGKKTAQICLHAGANDMGSIMIEENVVSAAGAEYSLNKEQIQDVIRESGFIPSYRNQRYEYEN